MVCMEESIAVQGTDLYGYLKTKYSPFMDGGLRLQR
jgi:hypothetical protein